MRAVGWSAMCRAGESFSRSETMNVPDVKNARELVKDAVSDILMTPRPRIEPVLAAGLIYAAARLAETGEKGSDAWRLLVQMAEEHAEASR